MTVSIHTGFESPAGEVTLFTLTNSCGAVVILSTLGAGIVDIRVPDRVGLPGSVTFGYARPADYFRDGPCAGKTIGRVANRIAGASFSLDGTTYMLEANDGKNALHGGMNGFMNRIWEAEVLTDGVRFHLWSADGDGGYPGAVDVHVTYRWNDDCVLSIGYDATTDRPTVLNLTNHTYFNLDGQESDSIADHMLRICASGVLETDSAFIPTGRILQAAGAMDFASGAPLGPCLDAEAETLRLNRGLNHYYVFDKIADSSPACAAAPAATLWSDVSGRRLDIFTSYPGIMVYTGGWLADSPADRTGRPHRNHQAVALECQGYPDAPNHPGFPPVVLLPGQHYHHTIIYGFSIF